MSYVAHTPDQLGKILLGYRKTQGMTQKDVASRVALLPKSVSAIENNPQSVSIRLLFSILSALDLELVVRPRGLAITSSESLE